MKLNGLLIESIEGRITLGVTMFVAIMILIGWVAINEPARMASFEQQHTGRSIERGAELFASNCSTCHGTDGRGQAGRAPALNSPHLFGYDFLAQVNGEIGRLQRNVTDLRLQVESLTAEREELITEFAAEDTSTEREQEITDRLAEIDNQIDPDVEGSLAARIAAIEEEIEPLLVERETQLAQLQPAFLRNYLPQLDDYRQAAEEENDPLLLTNYIAEDASRLTQAGWGGDVRSFLTTTLIHGRPGSGDTWGASPGDAGSAMAAWSQLAGGPLREDQINDIVNFILNWDKGDGWTMGDLMSVQQFARIKADEAQIVTDTDAPQTVGTDVDAILETISGLTGDAERGRALYYGEEPTGSLPPAVLGCAACHVGGAVGPALEGTWTRTQDARLTQPELEGYSVEQYIVESIVAPQVYMVSGYAGGMPGTYGDQLLPQDMADIIAFLQTQQ